MTSKLRRRDFLTVCGGVSALMCTNSINLFGAEPQTRYKIGICDWDLGGVAGNPKSFEVAKGFGFDGVEVSYSPDGEFSLSKKENRKLFLDAAKKANCEISSIAMGLLNGRPLATVPEAEQWVVDCIDAMLDMNVKKVLLAFFGDGDIKDNLEARKTVIEKLKRLGPIAEKQGRILCVESYLSAREHLDLLQAVGCDAVKVYYDEQNMLTKEYPIYEDMELLLKEKAIAQVHMKEYDARLGEGKVDFTKIKNLLVKYDYKDWLVVETSVKGDWKESQTANAAYLRKLFNQ